MALTQQVTMQTPPQKNSRNVLFGAASVMSGGIAGCTAEIISIPLDTMKVKAQTLSTTNTKSTLFSLINDTFQKGGVRAFYGGRVCVTAAFQRQMVMASVKFGCYDIVKEQYCNLFDVSNDPRYTPKYLKILSASTTGALGVLIGQPTDVVKVRTQATLDTYKSTIQAYKEIYRFEGIRKGLWRGAFPGMLRNSAVNSAEIGAYDIIKGSILRHNLMEDRWPCFVFCSFWVGCLATAVSSPADVLKTVYSNAKPGEFKNLWDCAKSIWSHGGIPSFYRGATFNGSRLIIWNMLMFSTLEYLRGIIKNAR